VKRGKAQGERREKGKGRRKTKEGKEDRPRVVSGHKRMPKKRMQTANSNSELEAANGPRRADGFCRHQALIDQYFLVCRSISCSSISSSGTREYLQEGAKTSLADKKVAADSRPSAARLPGLAQLNAGMRKPVTVSQLAQIRERVCVGGV
jgi:hypothetical protein